MEDDTYLNTIFLLNYCYFQILLYGSGLRKSFTFHETFRPLSAICFLAFQNSKVYKTSVLLFYPL